MILDSLYIIVFVKYYYCVYIHYNHYAYTCIACCIRIRPYVILKQEHSIATMNSEMRSSFVSLNFLWCLFFCSRSLSLSHHFLCFSWTKVSPGTGVSNSDYFITLYVGIHQVTHPANMLVSKQRVHGKPT